jgi:hypothetical protein
MRATLKRLLAGMVTLAALMAAPARGSDPITRPVVGTPQPKREEPNLSYLFQELKPAAGALLTQEPRAVRDDAVVQTQIAPERPESPGRMPSSQPRPGTSTAAAPSPAPLPEAPATSAPAPLPAGVVETPAWTDLELDVPPPMIGDQAPLSLRSPFASSLPQRLGIALPWARGFKIADNMSPRPMDRVFFTFNYFNNLDGSINSRVAPGLGGMQAYRYVFGYEKTFWDGNASIGVRLPLDSLSARRLGTSTALGNLTVFSKLIVLQQPGTGNLVSAGLAVTMPTGPSSFGGERGVFGYRDAQIQPFVGYTWMRGRFYVQGFEAIDIPTDANDVTMQYNDAGIGYFVYRDADPGALLSAIAPTFEAHANIPLNHVGAFRGFDPAGTPDVVDLTFGVNILFRQRSMLTVGFVNPVTGPRPFSQEWTLLFNYFFGRTRPLPAALAPPVAGL